MSSWIDLVKSTYDKNKTKKNYSLKMAMKDAKKVYKKGGNKSKKNLVKSKRNSNKK